MYRFLNLTIRSQILYDFYQFITEYILFHSTILNMAKKTIHKKLIHSKPNQKKDLPVSAFNSYANKLTLARKKKIEKIGDTKKRLMQQKKENKMMKVSKRVSKFSLLDDAPSGGGLTHKGKKIEDIKQFNDMEFGSDMENQEFQKMHENINFTGFDEEPQEKIDLNQPKSKKQVYKEIIEKSKAYKNMRQEIYQNNFNSAVELDQKFPELVSSLKFRNRDSNAKDRVNQKDHEFDRLANQLRDEERVVSNKIVEKTQKYTEKMRQKKNEQLNQLMKDSEEEGDIRGWIKNVAEDQDQNAQNEGDEDEDEIDDIQLSSGDEEEEEEQGQDDVELEVEGQQNQNSDDNENDEEQPEQDSLEQEQEPEVEQQSSEKYQPLQKKAHGRRKRH